MAKGRDSAKQLEKVIKLIHETFKDRPDTKVYLNHKLIALTGGPREFDVFVETVVQGVSIKIAVECKAYNKAVRAEKIEAFKGKCDLFPEINRKIFVSQSGYQSGAVTSAATFGIELYDLKNIDKEVLFNSFPVSQLRLVYQITGRELVIDAPEYRLDDLKAERFNEVFLGDEELKQDLDEIIKEQIKEHKDELGNANLLAYMEKGGYKSLGEKFKFVLPINLDRAFIRLKSGAKFPAYQLIASIASWYVEKPIKVGSTQVYSSKGVNLASRMQVMLDEDSSSDIIVTKDRTNIFITDGSGTTTELGGRAMYDRKTNTLNFD